MPIRLWLILTLAPLMLSACEKLISIDDATAVKSSDGIIISANVRETDARFFKDNEIYVNFFLVDCKNPQNKYPFDARLHGKKSPEFDVEPNSYTVTMQGIVESNIYRQFPNPCLLIRGGSYFSASVRSYPVKIRFIDRDAGKGL